MKHRGVHLDSMVSMPARSIRAARLAFMAATCDACGKFVNSLVYDVPLSAGPLPGDLGGRLAVARPLELCAVCMFEMIAEGRVVG